MNGDHILRLVVHNRCGAFVLVQSVQIFSHRSQCGASALQSAAKLVCPPIPSLGCDAKASLKAVTDPASIT